MRPITPPIAPAGEMGRSTPAVERVVPACDASVREGASCTGDTECSVPHEAVIYCGLTISGYQCQDRAWQALHARCSPPDPRAAPAYCYFVTEKRLDTVCALTLEACQRALPPAHADSPMPHCFRSRVVSP